MKTSRVRIDHLYGVVILLVVVLLIVGGTTVSGLTGQLDRANEDAANWAEADTAVTEMILTSFDTQHVIHVGVTEQTGSSQEFVEHATGLVVQVSDIDSQVRPFLTAEEADKLAGHAEAIITDLNEAVMAATSALSARERGDEEAAVRVEADVESSFAEMRSGVTALQDDFRAFHAADLVVRSEEAASARTLVLRIAVAAAAVLVIIIYIGWRVRYRERLATLERRRSAERLQAYADDLDAEKALLGGVIETIPLEISWKDADLRIVGCNESYAAYFGVPPTEGEGGGVGREVSEWCDREIVAALNEIEREVLETGEPAVGIELEDKTQDGSVSFVASVVPLVAGDGAPGLLTVLDDVTEQVSMQMQLQQAQKLESVGQLAAGIAHEINTPMQYIGDNAHFLKATVQRLLTVVDSAEKMLDDDEASARDARDELQTRLEKAKLPLLRERAPKAADDALSGVENVSRIVRAMKRFSHPGSDEMAPVDINEALDTTLTVCKNEWKYAADLETDFADLPPVEANLGPLNQVWLNLIVNAAHAVSDRFGDGEKGLIRVKSCLVDDDHIAVSVSDNGCGIAEENLQKVFDHFFTTKAVGKGTGQGLAIAHQVVVDEHGGRIDLDSVVGEGTTFTLTLPIRQSAGDASAGEASADELVA